MGAWLGFFGGLGLWRGGVGVGFGWGSFCALSVLRGGGIGFRAVGGLWGGALVASGGCGGGCLFPFFSCFVPALRWLLFDCGLGGVRAVWLGLGVGRGCLGGFWGWFGVGGWWLGLACWVWFSWFLWGWVFGGFGFGCVLLGVFLWLGVGGVWWLVVGGGGGGVGGWGWGRGGGGGGGRLCPRERLLTSPHPIG